MQEVITRLVDVPFARMFVLAGIIFLLVAVLGKVEGKIDPGNVGRIGASVLGVVLLIIGVVMQYIEIRELSLERAAQQSRMQPQNAAAPAAVTAKPATPDASSKQAGTPEATAADRPAIKVVSGTYGRNCNGKAGNATQQIAKSCDGKSVCDYAIEPVELENAPANCAKDFAAEWKCGSGNTVYTAILPVGPDKNPDKNEKLHLACAM